MKHDLGQLFITGTSSSSYFFNKTDLEQYLFYTTLIKWQRVVLASLNCVVRTQVGYALELFFYSFSSEFGMEVQCRRQSNRSEGALAESGGGGDTKINWIFAHKTDILRLQIMRYFRNFALTFEKRDV